MSITILEWPSAPQARHRRNGAPDVQNNAACACHPQHPATRFSCARHDPEHYAEGMARHATDSIVPVDRDPWCRCPRAHTHRPGPDCPVQ